MKSILVVCEGNICRSPMAQGVLTAALPEVQVQSAGLGALIGMPADSVAIRILQTRGIDISQHRAQQVNRVMCTQAALVLVMDGNQRKRLEYMYPQTCGRVFRIGEYIGSDIPDPYQKSESAFRTTMNLLEAGISEWLRRIQRL